MSEGLDKVGQLGAALVGMIAQAQINTAEMLYNDNVYKDQVLNDICLCLRADRIGLAYQLAHHRLTLADWEKERDQYR